MKKIAFYLFLAAAPVWAAPSPASSSPQPVSQQERNKAVARRVFDEIFNQSKFQVADEIYSRDFVNHGQHKDADLAQDQAAVHFEKQACPDLKMTIGPMLAESDLVSVLWTARGTNTARVGWLPATGVKIELRGITIWRIVDGRIREEWTSFNEMTVLSELISQLRWQLLGLLCTVSLLVWIAFRLIGRLRASHRSPLRAPR